ncbi:uncharacterized protein LOC129754910 isoform X2 [Uranotaenia lowii]|uniref:uncharacterized protein LOC129754910 isoform X2 n=1 Tax=Uranotaenia lowii TaxID=190385 RepID=UPI00247A3D54|nr:uncharacterized protein LOC129754910 isoform X2 [Uranotaenia lowii]
MVKRARLSYERLTFTTIELNLLLTNITSLHSAISTPPTTAAFPSGPSHGGLLLDDSVIGGLPSTNNSTANPTNGGYYPSGANSRIGVGVRANSLENGTDNRLNQGSFFPLDVGVAASDNFTGTPDNVSSSSFSFGVGSSTMMMLPATATTTTTAANPSSTYPTTAYPSGPHPTVIAYEIRDPLWIVIPISIIYSTIFVIGVLGNVITCIVISRNRSMHTATNYYLFSLAISDLLLLLSGVPQEIYFIWFRFPYPFDNNVCMLQGFAAETSANATVLTITAFTVERYVAICKPFLSHTMSKLSRAVRFILAIWVIAMCLAVPQALALQIDEEFSTCTVRRDWQQHVFTISTVLVFVFPMCVLTILYVLIGLQLRRSKVMKRGTQLGSSVRLKHSIFKKSSNRTVVSINYHQNNDSPQHYSESMLTTAMQQHHQSSSLTPSPLQPKLSLPLSIGGGGGGRSEHLNNNGLFYGGDSNHHHHQHPHLQQPHQSQNHLQVGNSVHVLVEQTNSLSSEDGRINYSNRAQYHSTKHVVKMLVAVVIAFFLCWAPFHAQRLFAVYGNDQNHNKAIRIAFDILTYVSGVLYFMSTCINPVLYNIMSHKFREAFKRMFFRNASLRSNSPNSQSLNTCSTVCCTLAAPPGGPGNNNNNSQSVAVTLESPSQSSSGIEQLRYMETDLIRLKRPLVVSFRKPQSHSNAPRIFHPNDHHHQQHPKAVCINNGGQRMIGPGTAHWSGKSLNANQDSNQSLHNCSSPIASNTFHRPAVKSGQKRSSKLDHWLPIRYFTTQQSSGPASQHMVPIPARCQSRCCNPNPPPASLCSSTSNEFPPTKSHYLTSGQLQCQYDLYPHLRSMYHLSSNPDLSSLSPPPKNTHSNPLDESPANGQTAHLKAPSPYASPQLSEQSKAFEQKLNQLLQNVKLEKHHPPLPDQSSQQAPQQHRRKRRQSVRKAPISTTTPTEAPTKVNTTTTTTNPSAAFGRKTGGTVDFTDSSGQATLSKSHSLPEIQHFAASTTEVLSSSSPRKGLYLGFE